MSGKLPVVALATILAATPAAIAAKRARPPQWSREVVDIFFDDARKELNGPRPDYNAKPTDAVSSPRATDNTNDPGAVFSWSHLIDATTLETEVKRLAPSLDAATKNPSEFKAGGYKSARRELSELAVLFAVIGQYDGPVRWQDVAAAMRGQMARAGFDCKAGTDATHRSALDRRQDLALLVRGERPDTPKSAAEFRDWSQLADRPPLMQRMDIATEERLKPWLADAATLRRNRDNILHEAQIVTMLAEVIHREAYEYWDDETFVDYSRQLRDAADGVATAAAAEDYERARAALGRATAACTECHAGYRG